MELQLKSGSSLAIPKKVFVEDVLHIAEKEGSVLDFDGKSGSWVTKGGGMFGLSFGRSLDFDQGLFELCRCYVITLGINLEIPE